MQILMIALRLVHIFGGVFWVGSTFLIGGFLTPAINAAGPDGAKVMQKLIGGTRMSPLLAAAAYVTALSGLIMYALDFGSNLGAITSSGFQLLLTIGGLSGLVATAIGSLYQGRASARMMSLGKEIQAAGGPPNPAQLAEMQGLRERLANGTQWTTIALVVALLAMSIARYV